jgi:hypothetical protein
MYLAEDYKAPGKAMFYRWEPGGFSLAAPQVGKTVHNRVRLVKGPAKSLIRF